MNTNPDTNRYYYIALICSVMFLLTSWLWTYFINLIIAYPDALLALWFWNKGKQSDENKERYKLIPIILLTGLAVSAVSFFLYK